MLTLLRNVLSTSAAALVVSGCVAAGKPALNEQNALVGSDPCAPGGKMRKPNPDIVATTRTNDGQVIDWIPAASQTPNGVVATPPPPTSMPLASPAVAGIGPEAQGPKGTVPVIRSRQTLCDCYAGFAMQADGTCASIEASCVHEGGTASAKTFSSCCPGLTRSENVELVDGQCMVNPPDAQVCTRCGNGACGSGENSCNCPSDCAAH